MAVEEELRYASKSSNLKMSPVLHKLLDEIDTLNARLDSLNHYYNHIVTQALELEYTFKNNRHERNTMTILETIQ